MVVHVGVVLVAVAIAASGSYDTERELTLEVGDTASVAGHEIGYLGARTVEESNKTSVRARVTVDGEVHEPAINRFDQSGQSIGTPSVATSLTQDVYLTLLREPADDAGQAASVRVIVQPLVTWLWIGGIVMALGTVLAAFPGRRRNPIDPVSAPLPDGDVAGAPAGPSPATVPAGRGGPGPDRGDGDGPGDDAGGEAGDGEAGGDRHGGTPEPIEVGT
jgi:cytochrome c-type biogenesis protein CcmF